MKYISREVTSNQSGVHEKIAEIIDKNRRFVYKKPIQNHNKLAFESAFRIIQECEYSPILDSCCGTGHSTVWLANQFPERVVIGIDQSEVRLHKQHELPANAYLLRTNCEDFWRLCSEANIVFYRHFILYPNPWPKSEHIKRRWHGHPVFTYLPQLSESIEVRSNWSIYIDEFALAWKLLTGKKGVTEEYKTQQYVTRFEEKYSKSGQALFRFFTEK
ncbi:MAG: SAM-dependent methyltransferase [Gammaproteobacteria bacterium]|nr:SAM-dependent methyltransferase [Gammaproteobacteria bacterium]